MANYRRIHQKIWDDPDFQEYSPYQKLVFLYLCTNNLTTESGIYSISLKTISRDTDVPEDEIMNLLKNMKNVKYDFVNKVVFIVNLKRYQGGGSPEKVKQSIANDYKFIHTELWSEFKKQYPEYSDVFQIVDKQLANSSIPTPIPVPIPNPDPTPKTTEREILNIDSTINKIPVEQMRAIFERHWEEHNKGNYTPDYQREEEVAERLYEQCRKDYPDDPLRVFRRKVERLYDKYNIRCFSGLEKYWNFAAGEKI